MQPTDATYRLNNRKLRIRQIQAMEIEVALDGGVWRKTFRVDEDRTDRDLERATEVALAIYGRRNADRALVTPLPNCSSSTVHDIWNAMRDIAGC